jgi:hypothetical protein
MDLELFQDSGRVTAPPLPIEQEAVGGSRLVSSRHPYRCVLWEIPTSITVTDHVVLGEETDEVLGRSVDMVIVVPRRSILKRF